jgi:hypothetical protein
LLQAHFLGKIGMAPEDRCAARITVNIRPAQAEELKRIAKDMSVSLSWLLRRSLERTIEEANGEPMLPIQFPKGGRNAA